MPKLKGLSKKQLGFAKDYLDTGNATHSALKNYNVKNERVASVIGSQNLAKLDIIEYFRSVSSEVSANMHRLVLNAESEQVQVAAGKDILDRAGYKPVEQSEVKGTLKISFDPVFKK